MVSRIYVEKKPGFDVEAHQLLHELRTILGIESLTGIRLINRYDVEGASDEPQKARLFSPSNPCPASSTSAPLLQASAFSSSARGSAPRS